MLMELIPVINFETLNNPSFLSRILSVFELGKLSPAHRFWKWAAIFLAFVYAFNYVVTNKLKLLLLHYHHKSKSFLSGTPPLLYSAFDDELYSSDDEEDESDAGSSSSDDEEDEQELSDDDEEREINGLNWIQRSYEDFSKFEDDFTVKGQKRKFRVLRRKKSIGDDFSLSDLVNGNGIVKLWDGFGLGVDSSFPFLEINKDDWKKFGSFFGSDRGAEPGLIGLRVWDFRCSENEPVVQTTWRADRTGRTMGDVRMIETALTENVTEEGEEMWWDADGVSG